MTQAVVLDVGGTFVKYGVAQDGAIGEAGQFPIRENGTKEEILGPILAFLKAHPAPVVAVSIPGPMDYPRGMSLMKHKFAALYGVSLADWLGERLPGTRIVFVHDGVAFALGEMADGALAGCSCAAGTISIPHVRANPGAISAHDLAICPPTAMRSTPQPSRCALSMRPMSSPVCSNSFAACASPAQASCAISLTSSASRPISRQRRRSARPETASSAMPP